VLCSHGGALSGIPTRADEPLGDLRVDGYEKLSWRAYSGAG
jgi:hypothetical protein